MLREGFPHAERQPTGALTLSGGAAVYPDDGHEAGELLALANRALRRAKQEGKNRILTSRDS